MKKESAGNEITAVASPSLALLKYWGKQDGGVNIPATPSIAVTLGGLESRARVAFAPDGIGDLIVLNGQEQPAHHFAPMLNELRRLARDERGFVIESSNNFPTAAGLASSSSGFAAVAGAAARLLGLPIEAEQLSPIARIGSGSAARAVFGGFTLWPAGALSATPLHPVDFWPELRVVVVTVSTGAKSISSRAAMEATRRSSPYYEAWVRDAGALLEDGIEALAQRDLEKLGVLMRRSYMRMFGSMLAADDPILYWRAGSLNALLLCEELRARGIQAWETMDAGPQVKILTEESAVDLLLEELHAYFPQKTPLVASPGPGLRFVE
ncbi:MAG: diphosphomevalonate decarboxylase [Spirochaeta sp.]|nr:diphosphomevalonate decarboxylase [Spirochaeta sp.]